jgi:uncharacterized metal-binding protein YceD (DUF177 family)
VLHGQLFWSATTSTLTRIPTERQEEKPESRQQRDHLRRQEQSQQERVQATAARRTRRQQQSQEEHDQRLQIRRLVYLKASMSLYSVNQCLSTALACPPDYHLPLPLLFVQSAAVHSSSSHRTMAILGSY